MDYFSQRNDIEDNSSNTLLYESITTRFRNALWNYYEDYNGLGVFKWSPLGIYKKATRDFKLEREFEIDHDTGAKLWIKRFIKEESWNKVLDFLELIISGLDEAKEKYYKTFIISINDLLSSESMGYKVDNAGKVEKIIIEYIDSFGSKDALELLKKQDKWSGPKLDFEKAISHLNNKNNPDTENAIKDAIGSIEGVARIILNKPKEVLSKLIPVLVEQGYITKPLDEMINKLYAFRGNEEGVGHGRTKSNRTSFIIAYTIVNISGNIINMLINKDKQIAVSKNSELGITQDEQEK